MYICNKNENVEVLIYVHKFSSFSIIKKMSIIKEAVILHIKIAIAVIFVMPNNPEVQEYFHKYFILFSKIIYIILYI